ncbi:MAG: methyltransferase domain-containing protein, partial [Solirubrobacteraceae bacterium]
MLAVARERAQAAGLTNVEFRQLELEWIDMDAASVDAILCRWGIMLIVDPAAAATEIRRVLRPGGRAAFAVWDEPARNPWATIPGRVMIELGHSEPPDPGAPGMFTLAPPGRLSELLQSAGFAEVTVAAVALERRYARLADFVEETVEMSPMFSAVYGELDPGAQAEATERVIGAARGFAAADGSVRLPGSSLVAVATA